MPATLHADPPSEACTAFAAVLDAVVDGEADARLVAECEAHTATCASCAQRLTTARAYRTRMRRVVETNAASATLRERVRRILQAVRGSPTH